MASPSFSRSRRRRVQFLGTSVGSSMPFVEFPLRVTLISVNCTSSPSRIHVLLFLERLSFLILLPPPLSAEQPSASAMESTVAAKKDTQLPHDPSSTALVTNCAIVRFTLFEIFFVSPQYCATRRVAVSANEMAGVGSASSVLRPPILPEVPARVLFESKKVSADRPVAVALIHR